MAIDVIDRVLRRQRGNRPGEQEDSRPLPPKPPKPKQAPPLADVLRRVNKTPAPPKKVPRPTTDMARDAQKNVVRFEDDSKAYRPPSMPGRTMYNTKRAEPTYNDSYFWQESAPDRSDYGRSWAQGLPAPSAPMNATSSLGSVSPQLPPPPTWRAALRPSAQLQPPATTGAAIGPPGVLRAQTAGAYGYSDKAREALSQTPIQWGGDPENRHGYYRQGKFVYMSPRADTSTMAHETSHKRWFEDLQAQNPATARDFMRDTNAIASQSPAIQSALQDWQQSTPYYQKYHNNPNAGTDLGIAPTEIHARVAQFATSPKDMPDWYRAKWYPGVWSQNDIRVGNQTPRFDQERPPYRGMIPDENGNYG